MGGRKAPAARASAEPVQGRGRAARTHTRTTRTPPPPSLPPKVRTAGLTPNEVAIDGDDYAREHRRMVQEAEAKRQALFDLQDAIENMEPEHVARGE